MSENPGGGDTGDATPAKADLLLSSPAKSTEVVALQQLGGPDANSRSVSRSSVEETLKNGDGLPDNDNCDKLRGRNESSDERG